MTAPTIPKALTRSKVGRRLREAYELIGQVQQQVRTKSAQAQMLRVVWRTIEQAEADALEEVRQAAEARNRRLAKRAYMAVPLRKRHQEAKP